MSPSRSLRSQIFWGLAAYLVILTAVLLSVGDSIHEAAEHQAWGSMLRTELANYRERSETNPDYRWQDTDSLTLQRTSLAAESLPFPDLAPGLYDDLRVGDQLHAVLIQHVDGERLVISVDITRFDALERDSEVMVLLLTGSAAAALLLALIWGINHLVRPLRRLRDDVARLEPTDLGQRLLMDRYPVSDVAQVAERFNTFLDSNQSLMQREHRFIQTSSHELRTPVAAISGAAELALSQPGLPAAVDAQLRRIRQSALGMERLIALLLTLARSPERIAEHAERVDIRKLLPQIVDDHRFLLQGRSLEVACSNLSSFEIIAPPYVVISVIANLLRNAIEHSDQGQINLTLDDTGEVRICDPGNQRSPEEISAHFASQARQAGHIQAGIGLELVARLSQHMGWQLHFQVAEPRGTCAILDLSASACETPD